MPFAAGGGVTVFEPFVAFAQLLPAEGFVQAQAGLELPFDTAIAGREAFWRVTAGKSFSQGRFGRSWSPMVELLAARVGRLGHLSRTVRRLGDEGVQPAMLVELGEMRVGHFDGARFLSSHRRRQLGEREIGEPGHAYSTTFGTVKKPPAFLSVGSM